MEFDQVLSQRKMVRRYRDAPVDLRTVRRIAAAGERAPAAGGTGGRRLEVVTDPGLRREIARRAGEDGYVEKGYEPWLSRAPAHIIPCVSPAAYVDRYRLPDKSESALAGLAEGEWPVPYWWVDIGAALQNLLLAAVDEGLVAGFLGAHAVPGLGGLLRLPADFRPIGVVTVGFPAPADRHNPPQHTPQPAPAPVPTISP